MKLYTEEEIVSFLKREFSDEINAETFMENLAPIELLADEDIIEIYNDLVDFDTDWIIGAIWMRDKIQGGEQ